MPRRWALAILAVLAGQFAVLAIAQAWRDAPTFDEPINLASGLTALTRHDLRLNVEHPPLAKTLAAAPALAARPVIPDGNTWRLGYDSSYTADFLRQNDESGRLRRATFLARLVPIGAAVLVGFAIYALAARLFGRVEGVVAGALWLLTPLVLGHGHLDGLDVPFTLATLAACLALDRYLERPERARAVALGLACSACLLVRTSGLVVMLAVVATVAVVGRHRPRRAWAHVGLLALVAWLALWACYRLLAPVGSDGVDVAGPSIAGLLPLPTEYKAGLLEYDDLGGDTRSFFLLGDYSPRSTWWYWPLSLVVKLPPSALVLLPLGVLAWWTVESERRRRAVAVVVVPALALSAATAALARPIGVRYLLPVLALGCVAAGPMMALVRRRGAIAMVVALLLAAQLAMFVSSVPHTVAWTSPLFRPPYQVAADSNVDWGQDFYRLRAWSEGKRPWVAWLGPLRELEIPGARPLLDVDAQEVTGWAAVNASTLTLYARDELSWLRAYCPVDAIGGSVLVYYFERAPTGDPGPDAPASVCEGSSSRRP